MKIVDETPFRINDKLKELEERLAEKQETLQSMSQNVDGVEEAARLKGKAEGVALAISFVNEMRRDLDPDKHVWGFLDG